MGRRKENVFYHIDFVHCSYEISRQIAPVSKTQNRAWNDVVKKVLYGKVFSWEIHSKSPKIK